MGNSLDNFEISTIHSFLYMNIIKPFAWLIEDEYNLNLAEVNGHEEFFPRMSILREWRKKTEQKRIRDFDQMYKDMSKILLKFEDGELCWKRH